MLIKHKVISFTASLAKLLNYCVNIPNQARGDCFRPIGAIDIPNY